MSYAFASTLYRTEKEMAVAIVAEFISAGGRNNREEVEEYLEDWTGTLAEMRAEWDLTEEQEKALRYYVDEGRIGPDDVLRYLYAVASVHEYKTASEIGWADEDTYSRYLDAVEDDDTGVVPGEDWGYPGHTIYMG
jgi:hypothetical protein